MPVIGVISDTHGLLRPEAVAALEGSEIILHAGDVGDLAILDALGRIAPVYAVYGNTDYGAVRSGLPRSVVVDLLAVDGRVGGAEPEGDGGGVQVLAYVHHGYRELDLAPGAAGTARVVSGHTHRPLVEERGGVLYLNPGSAGPRRFTLPVTVARVRLGGGEGGGGMQVELVPLDVA